MKYAIAAVIPRRGTMPAKIHLATEDKPIKADGRSTLLVLNAVGSSPDGQ